jgi:ComF family protein
MPSRRREDVFSSSGDRTRPTRADNAAKGSFIASWFAESWLAESLFASLFPADCRICGHPLTRISRLPVCNDCLDTMRPIAGGLCAICGERLVSPHAFAGEHGDTRCGLCHRVEPPFAKAAAYGSYEGGLRDLIHMLKYQQVRPAANVLGRMLAEVFATLEPSFGVARLAVVPVPLYAAKLRQRGFNQAELMARVAMKLAPERGRYAMADALERIRDTQSQIGLTRHQRRENLRGAFQVKHPEKVSGNEVLLVDDVFTTGTTVSECARVLRRAGATRVWVATVARTLKVEAQRVVLEPDSDADRRMAAHG